MPEVDLITSLAGMLYGARLSVEQLPEDVREAVQHVLSEKADRLEECAQLVAGGRTKTASETQPLGSIFSSLVIDGQPLEEESFVPIGDLAIRKEMIFPQSAAPKNIAAAYQTQWERFEGAVLRLSQAHAGETNLPIYLESLLLLAQRHLWCLASPWDQYINLYDQTRLTGALSAVALQSGFKKNKEPLALLIGGDLSGVQDFIYTITSRGAVSALRGRSFYLQLLTEAVARYVLRGLDLPITNLIYAGGGNFEILAKPNQVEGLEEIQRQISTTLMAHHRGDLSFVLAGQTVSAGSFRSGYFAEKRKAVGRKLQESKLNRFIELGDELTTIFRPQGNGGSEQLQCQVCGLEHAHTREVGDDQNEVRKCPPCLSYESLGKDLRQAAYLILTPQAIPSPPEFGEVEPGRWDQVLRHFGLEVKLASEGKVIPKQGKHNRIVFALKDEALADDTLLANTAFGRKLMVNVTPIVTSAEEAHYSDKLDEPIRSGTIKPFELLAKQAEGVNRLGVLRMDVDDLGNIFASGLQQSSLGRVAALSFAIMLYFEGWVEVLAETINQEGAGDVEKGDRLYSIYSGGDDLFFVGAWDAVVELARRIRADLRPYAPGHAGIHASAGIVLISNKYPLAQAAQDAGEAERQAKNLYWYDQAGQKQRKDAITFLGRVLPWDQFGLGACDQPGLGDAHALMHSLENLLKQEENNIPQSMIQNLLRMDELYQEAAMARQQRGEAQTQDNKPQALWGGWMWRGFYYLKRSKHEQVKALAEGLKKQDFTNMPWVGLSARWAMLKRRSSA